MSSFFLLLFLLACGANLHAAAQVTTYELVGGEVLFTTLRGHEKGQLLAVRRVGQVDTLLLWVEGVSMSSGPSREAAAVADIVAWCYPGRYPDKRHALPKARIVALAREEYDGKTWVSLVSGSTLDRFQY